MSKWATENCFWQKIVATNFCCCFILCVQPWLKKQLHGGGGGGGGWQKGTCASDIIHHGWIPGIFHFKEETQQTTQKPLNTNMNWLHA